MDKIDRQYRLLDEMSEDWHLLCDQYQFKHKPAFEKDAGLPLDENVDQVQDEKPLPELPEELIRPIQRYHRLSKLFRWFWRWFWSVDDLYQPLIIYYSENKQLPWKAFSEQLFQQITTLDLLAEWVHKKVSTITSNPMTFTHLKDRTKNISDKQKQAQNLILKSSSTHLLHTTEANKMKGRRRQPQFNRELIELYLACRQQLKEIAINQDFYIEKMIENLNNALVEYRQKFNALDRRFSMRVKNSQERCYLKIFKLNLYVKELIIYRFKEDLDHISQSVQDQVDRVKQDQSLSIEISLQKLADILEGWQQDTSVLYQPYIKHVSDSRSYQNLYETHEQSIRSYVAQANGELETLRRENWHEFESALEKKIERYRNNMQGDVQENQRSPKKQWQAIEDHLKQAHQEIEVLCAQYKQSGRANEEKESLEYEIYAQTIAEKVSSHAYHLQQSTGALTLYNNRAQNSAQLMMFWQHDQSTITAWAVKRSQLLGRILNAEQRRVAIGTVLIELEQKCQKLRVKYHPDKYPSTLKNQAECISKQGIGALEREASIWLMIGSQTYAKYAPKTQENELALEKLADESEQEIIDNFAKMTVSYQLLCANISFEKMLRKNYEASAQLVNYLEKLHLHYQRLEQLSASGKSHPSLGFWKECIQWYEKSMYPWNYRMNYWENLHFMKDCKNEDDKNRIKQGNEEILQLHQLLQEEIFPALRTINDQIEHCGNEKQPYSSPQKLSTLKDLQTLNRMHEEKVAAETAYREIEKYPSDEIKRISDRSARLEYSAKRSKLLDERIATLNEKVIQYMKTATMYFAEAALIQSRYHQGCFDFATLELLNDKSISEHKLSPSERLEEVQLELEKQYQCLIENRRKAGAKDHWDLDRTVLLVWLCRSQIQALKWGQTQWYRYQQGLIPQPPFPENKWYELFETTLQGLEQWRQNYQEEADDWDKVVVLQEDAKRERKRYEKERERRIALERKIAEYKVEIDQKKLKTENGRFKKPAKNTQNSSLWSNFFMSSCIIAAEDRDYCPEERQTEKNQKADLDSHIGLF